VGGGSALEVDALPLSNPNPFHFDPLHLGVLDKAVALERPDRPADISAGLLLGKASAKHTRMKKCKPN
jgi:hypothetical protein